MVTVTNRSEASISQSFTVTLVQACPTFTALVAGGGHTLALRNDGTVWAWGGTEQGQTGDGTLAALAPVKASWP